MNRAMNERVSQFYQFDLQLSLRSWLHQHLWVLLVDHHVLPYDLVPYRDQSLLALLDHRLVHLLVQRPPFANEG